MPPFPGSRPGRRIKRHADVAQLVERKLPKLEVAGSTPVVRFAGLSARAKKQMGFATTRSGADPPTTAGRSRLVVYVYGFLRR
jgi:hypothetical protein